MFPALPPASVNPPPLPGRSPLPAAHLQDEVEAIRSADDAVGLLTLRATLTRDSHQPEALGERQAQGGGSGPRLRAQAQGSAGTQRGRDGTQNSWGGALTGLQVVLQGTWLQDTWLSCVELSVTLVQTHVSHPEEYTGEPGWGTGRDT